MIHPVYPISAGQEDIGTKHTTWRAGPRTDSFFLSSLLLPSLQLLFLHLQLPKQKRAMLLAGSPKDSFSSSWLKSTEVPACYSLLLCLTYTIALYHCSLGPVDR